jgi:hypothetical protein
MKLLVLSLLTTFLFTPPAAIVEKWVIEKSSNLCIEGKSNVSSFQCDVIRYLQVDTIFFYKDDRQLVTTKGGITIDVNTFDCHQRYITADLRKTLKAKECPLLRIDLLSIGNLPVAAGDYKTTGWVAIQLAGITRKIEVNYTVQAGNNGVMHLYGSQRVTFADFSLTPPKKLAGLIKVEEEINVKFRLILRAV